MADRYFQQFQGTLEHGVVKLFGSVTTTTSGTVGSQTSKGFTVAKTGSETGRYTITLADKYQSLLSAHVMVEGAADAAYTSAKGSFAFLRNVSVASGPSLDIQFADADGSPADAELENGAKFYIELTLKNSTAY